MAMEPKRGCGYRRAGGLYLVSDGLGEPCERLPIPLAPCPTCGAGVRQVRGWQWLAVGHAFAEAKACAFNPAHCPRCMVCQPVLLERHAEPKDKVGLMWVGEKHYRSPQEWTAEAARLGASKRISAIPKGLVLGKTLILVAHPRAIIPADILTRPLKGKKPEDEMLPGVFHAFIPKRAELIVTPEMKKEKWVEELVEKQGVELVEVPADDPDHAPVVRESRRKKSLENAAKKAAKNKKEESHGEGPAQGEEGDLAGGRRSARPVESA